MTATRVILCVVAALVVHTAVILFGGILFNREETHSSQRDVELLSEDVQKDKPQEKLEEQVKEEIKAEQDAPPDPSQIKSAEMPSENNDAPALDAASLSAIEAALNGAGGAGGGDGFGGAASLSSGGRIGGTGRAVEGGEKDEFAEAFSMSQIDQRPRAVYQVAAAYPSALRAQAVEGVVTLIFVVDETGRVVNPRVEKSTHTEFEAPALDAVRQWRFEPAVKAGKRVSCRMRVPVRFQPR